MIQQTSSSIGGSMITRQRSNSFLWFFLLLFLIGGCQSGSPTSPVIQDAPNDHGLLQSEAENTVSRSENRTTGEDLFVIRNLLGGRVKSVVGLVTPLLGGTLNLSKSRLVVPPLAVLIPTLVNFSIITAAPEGLPGALNRVYEFSPDGLIFLLPSSLYISFSDAGVGNEDPSLYRFYYFNESQNRWESQPTQVDMSHGQYIVTLNHFSRYAFGR